MSSLVARHLRAHQSFHRKQRGCLVGVLLLVCFCGAEAQAGETTDPVPVRGPGFALVPQASGTQGCLPRPLAQEALTATVLRAGEQLGIDPQLVIVVSLDVPPCSDIFYVPVANDVGGIGYAHLYPEETFDQSPGAALEGVAFLNDWPYWERNTAELERAFLHEVGHRWSARVHVAGDTPGALLGRDGEHWSYFLHTGAGEGVSPLEGNRWQADGGGWTTTTDSAPPRYSALDLYLMGVLPPDDVPDVTLLRPSNLEAVDCDGASISASSPPQVCQSLQIQATPQGFTLADIVAVEGERSPPATDSVSPSWDVAFYVLAPDTTEWSVPSGDEWAAQVTRLTEGFRDATGDLMSLRNLTAGSDASLTCDALIRARDAAPMDRSDSAAKGGSCQISGAGRWRAGGEWLWSLLGLLLLRKAQRS